MLDLLSKAGRVKDVGLGLDWDSATLADEVNRRAAVLSEMGIGRGSVVAIAHSGTARFFADLFAAWRVGAAAACLDSTLTAGELQNVVGFANAAMLLVDGGKSADSLSVPVVELSNARPKSGATITAAHDPDDTALLLFTSGTTGTPKGVVLTFGALSARISANITAIGTPALAQALVTLPTFFGHGLIGNSLTPLLAGGTIVLHPRGIPLINNLGAIIDEHNISFMSSVPSLWRLALTCSPRPVGHSLRRVHVGSAPLSAALWSEIAAWSGAEVVNCYGITETANWIAGASSRADGIADGLVGKMWGGNAGVMDESGAIRNNGTGEIVVKSSCLMSGYYKRPDLTAAAFSQGYFRTGDQGLIDDNNCIWVTGRIKDEINRGGFKVQPAEIDALLESHPAVAEACVFGLPDPMGGEAIGAAIRLVDGESISPLSLQAWCGERLRRAAVPEHWFFVPEIPRTPRGKVSRDVVRRMLTQDKTSHELSGSTQEASGSADGATARSLPGAPVPPASDIERELLSLWESILGMSGLGVKDDYFALGGSSLMAARLMAEVSRRFAIKLPLATIIEAPTIRELANRLEHRDTLSNRDLITLRAGGPRQMFFVHDGVGETLLYRGLAQRLPEELSVVAIEPRRAPGMPVAFSRIEDMASSYIQKVREKQPHGPYLLGGMCAGGVIAYEMAAQLEKAGEKVELVTLLDAPAPQATKKTGRTGELRRQRLKQAMNDSTGNRSSAQRAISLAKTVSRKALNALVWEIYKRGQDLSIRARFALLKRLTSRGQSWPTLVPELSAQEILNSAQASYLPGPLSNAPTVLARATSGEGTDTPYAEIYSEQDLGWGKIAKRLTIIDVEGGHTSMLQEPFVRSLASELTPFVKSDMRETAQ